MEMPAWLFGCTVGAVGLRHCSSGNQPHFRVQEGEEEGKEGGTPLMDCRNDHYTGGERERERRERSAAPGLPEKTPGMMAPPAPTSTCLFYGTRRWPAGPLNCSLPPSLPFPHRLGTAPEALLPPSCRLSWRSHETAPSLAPLLLLLTSWLPGCCCCCCCCMS